jgi:hypothetical protein
MVCGPGDDRTRSGHSRAVVAQEHRDVLLAGQLEDLLTLAPAAQTPA